MFAVNNLEHLQSILGVKKSKKSEDRLIDENEEDDNDNVTRFFDTLSKNNTVISSSFTDYQLLNIFYPKFHTFFSKFLVIIYIIHKNSLLTSLVFILMISSLCIRYFKSIYYLPFLNLGLSNNNYFENKYFLFKSNLSDTIHSQYEHF